MQNSKIRRGICVLADYNHDSACEDVILVGDFSFSVTEPLAKFATRWQRKTLGVC